MSEWKLYGDDVPEYATAEWYAERERAPHLEQEPHRARLLLSARMIADTSPSSVVDLGCGDGGLLSLLTCPAWGYDLQPSNVAGGKERGVDVRYGDFLTQEIQWGELAVTTEVLEHLPDPHFAVSRISEDCRWLVASSPVNETDESHYAFHLWAWDQAGYAALLSENGWKVRAHELAGQFQVILGERV